MLDKYEKIWKQLNKFKIVKIKRISISERGTPHFVLVTLPPMAFEYRIIILGFNRVMILYEEMLKNSPLDDPKIELLGESGVILLIITLEAYFNRIFSELCRTHKIEDINKNKLKKFLNKHNLKFKYNYEEIKSISMSNFIPERLNFQDKETCKKAFELFDINLSSINEQIWETIYSKETGYMQLRHGLIHGGPDYGLYRKNRIDITYFKEILLNVAKFICQIDNEIIKNKKIDQT